MKLGAPPRVDERGLATPISVSSLIARFAIAGLISLLAVAAVTAFVSRRIGTDRAVDEAKLVARVSAVGVVAPALTDDILAADPTAPAQMALNAAVRKTVLSGQLVRVKIWDRDGRIVYSDDQRLIGQRFELGADELEVFGTDEVRAEVSDLSKPENYLETDSKLLEVYLATSTPNGTPLLFEAYFLYSGVTDVGRHLWTRFAPIAVGSLLLLELIQIPFAYSMAKRLRGGQLERERLLRHALDASDSERRRIASDLHDGVVQELTGVSLGLAAMGRGSAVEPQRVLDASSAVRGSIKSLRSLLVDIYPPNLQEEGLESAVGDLLGPVAARGIVVRLTVDLGSITPDRASSTLTYRVAQEALRNVVTHSGAHHVKVDVGLVDGCLQLTVDDDGRGFSLATLDQRVSDGHVGLRSLAGLVEDLGGSFAVSSNPGSGTRVTLRIPQSVRMP
jgi:two-component system, NarL family, sensor kinase